VLGTRARQVMAVLTVAVGRPTVHGLRAMRDAAADVVKNRAGRQALSATSHQLRPPISYDHFPARNVRAMRVPK
jgi:hypothetical protein